MKYLTYDEFYEELKNESSPEERIRLEVSFDISNLIDSIITARVDSGLTQRELAKKTGIKQSEIARMEKLQVMPKIDMVVRVCTYLGLTLNVVKKERKDETKN